SNRRRVGALVGEARLRQAIDETEVLTPFFTICACHALRTALARPLRLERSADDLQPVLRGDVELRCNDAGEVVLVGVVEEYHRVHVALPLSPAPFRRCGFFDIAESP